MIKTIPPPENWLEAYDKTEWIIGQLKQSPHTKITGYLGELLVMEALIYSDWKAYQPKARKIGDIIATNKDTGECLKIEVKTARQSKAGRWQFLLYKNDEHGQTDCSYSDVVVLVCISKAGLIFSFILPASEITSNKVSISSHPLEYSGKYARFYQGLAGLGRWLNSA